MKKVDREFLKEQVSLVLKEQQDKGCLPSPAVGSGGIWDALLSWDTFWSVLRGSNEAWDAIEDDQAMRMEWGKSEGSMYLKSAYVNKLSGADVYFFRFLKPVLSDATVGSVSIKGEIFRSFYAVIDEYAPKFAAVNTSAKGTTLGVFGETSVEDILRDFISDVEAVEEKYGLNDPQPSGWVWLKKDLGINMPAADVGRVGKTTDGWYEQESMYMSRFLDEGRNLIRIQNNLESIIVRGLGNIYFKAGVRSFQDINDYFQDRRRGAKMIEMISAAGYQKKLAETKTLWAWAEVIGSLIMTLTTVATLGGAAWVQGALGAAKTSRVGAAAARTAKKVNTFNNMAQAGKISKGAQATVSTLAKGTQAISKVATVPTDFLVQGVNMCVKFAVNRFQNIIITGTAKAAGGSLKLLIKTSHLAVMLLAEISLQMQNEIETLGFLAPKYLSVLDEFENVITNKQITDTTLFQDVEKKSDTVNYFSTMVKGAMAAIDDEGEKEEESVQEQNQEKPSKKLSPEGVLAYRKKLGEELLELLDRMYAAMYKDFGGMRAKCGVNVFKIEEEKKSGKSILAQQIAAENPDFDVLRQAGLLARGFKVNLETTSALFQERIKETKQKAAAMQGEISELDKARQNSIQTIQVPEIVSQRSFKGKSEAQPAQTPEKGEKTTKGSFGSNDLSSDDVLKNVQDSFGSNEKTSNQTLQDIQKSLATVKEGQDQDAVSVNIGYKDALEFAKGNEEFSADKTKNNIDKIAALISNKGKKVNITPVAKMTDDIEGVDKNKFNDFITDINSHIRKNKYSPMGAPKPAAPKAAAAGAETASLEVTPKDDLIIVGDSNSLYMAGKWYGRGKASSRKGELAALKFHQDKGELVAPSIGSASVSKILQVTKQYFEQKGENYKPRIAILHMGYNYMSKAYEPYVQTIDFLKSKGVSDIRVIELKVDPKKRSRMHKKSLVLNKKLSEIPGIKFIPNRSTSSSDGYHFRDPGKFYKDALGGITGAPSAAAGVTGTGATKSDSSMTVSNPRATEMVSDVQKYLKRELTTDENENLNKIYDAAIQNISYVKDRNAWNAIRRAYGTKESGNNYNPYKSTGSWKKNRYTGRYAIGPAPYEIARKIVSRYGVSMPNYKFINSRKWSEGSQEKYYNDPIAQEASFLGFISHNKKMVANQAQDAKDELSLPGIAHNIGSGGVKRWAQYRTQYRKTKDEQYLYKMWSLQDGNGTPGENFMRILLRQAGSKTPDLPMGFYWSGGSKKNDYKHLEKIKQFDSDLGNFIEENYTKNWKYDARIFAFSEGNYAEKLWNWVTTSGQNTFARRNTKRVSTNIKDYYNENGDPIGSPEGEFSVGAAGTAASVGTVAATQQPEQKVDYKGSLEQVSNFDELIDYFYDNFELQVQNMSGKFTSLDRIAEMAAETNLSAYRENKKKYLKLIHKKNFPSVKSDYIRDLNAAEGDKEKMRMADKKIAYFHRPIFYSRIDTYKVPNIKESDITFAFEPGSRKVSVNFGGSDTFYKQDSEGGVELKRFVNKMNELRELFGISISKLQSFRKSGGGSEEVMNVYYKFSQKFKRVLDLAVPIIADESETPLRRSYATTVLNRAFGKLS